MKGVILFLVFTICGVINSIAHIAKKDTILMGSTFNFSAVNDHKDSAELAISAALQEVIRIESMISSWDENSETALINKHAGTRPVKVSEELFYLINRSKKISRVSGGFFDISFESIKKVWDFESKLTKVPSDSLLQESVRLINYENIILDASEKTVFLKKKGMKIGFGAIGKGYAANRAKRIMLEMGINSGVVNAGGDLTAWGVRPDGSDWKVGIADPNDKHNVMSWLVAKDVSIVTSGSYEKFITINGEEYCHIINPKTGWPVKRVKSVTIIAEDAEIADALATTVFVLGHDLGLDLVNKLPGVECMMIMYNDAVLFSDNAKKNTIK